MVELLWIGTAVTLRKATAALARKRMVNCIVCSVWFVRVVDGLLGLLELLKIVWLLDFGSCSWM